MILTVMTASIFWVACKLCSPLLRRVNGLSQVLGDATTLIIRMFLVIREHHYLLVDHMSSCIIISSPTLISLDATIKTSKLTR
jgi:hypothetical protein